MEIRRIYEALCVSHLMLPKYYEYRPIFLVTPCRIYRNGP